MYSRLVLKIFTFFVQLLLPVVVYDVVVVVVVIVIDYRRLLLLLLLLKCNFFCGGALLLCISRRSVLLQVHGQLGEHLIAFNRQWFSRTSTTY